MSLVSLLRKFRPSLIQKLGKIVHVSGISTTRTNWDTQFSWHMCIIFHGTQGLNLVGFCELQAQPMRDIVSNVIPVMGDKIVAAVQLCFRVLKLAVEPSGALGLQLCHWKTLHSWIGVEGCRHSPFRWKCRYKCHVGILEVIISTQEVGTSNSFIHFAQAEHLEEVHLCCEGPQNIWLMNTGYPSNWNSSRYYYLLTLHVMLNLLTNCTNCTTITISTL